MVLYIFFTFAYSFLGMILINCKEIDLLNYLKGNFQVIKFMFCPFSDNYWYYLVVIKCCPNVLHHVASSLWNQSCIKIWKVCHHSKGHFQAHLFEIISQKRCMIWPMFLWNTYTKSYIMFQFKLRALTSDDHLRSNKGHITLNRLYLVNGALYDQSLCETHIVNNIWPFSLPYSISPWMILKCQIKVIELSAVCFSERKRVMTNVY